MKRLLIVFTALLLSFTAFSQINHPINKSRAHLLKNIEKGIEDIKTDSNVIVEEFGDDVSHYIYVIYDSDSAFIDLLVYNYTSTTNTGSYEYWCESKLPFDDRVLINHDVRRNYKGVEAKRSSSGLEYVIIFDDENNNITLTYTTNKDKSVKFKLKDNTGGWISNPNVPFNEVTSDICAY